MTTGENTEAAPSVPAPPIAPSSFSFYKGGEDVVAPREGKTFDWQVAAQNVRSQLGEALNARNVGFLLGSGCSSHLVGGVEFGVPTMKPLAEEFVAKVGETGSKSFATAEERQVLVEKLGVDLSSADYAKNLERLMEVLYSFQIALSRSQNAGLRATLTVVESVISKCKRFIVEKCSTGIFSGDDAVFNIYKKFYRNLIFRDRALPRPWIFTTNYDLFSETAMDRLGIPYSNGFSGTVERRFNPATFRYSLAEQLDISNRKWTAVESFVYLCKVHGSVNWIEDGDSGLFPIREVHGVSLDADRTMIYPAPTKQNASFGSPYSDLFREFQGRILRDQSVLFTIGYSFADEHVNNIIFQALTVPTFRLIAFVPPNAPGIVAKLRALNDPRIWIVGGDGPNSDARAHYFDVVIDNFMPEPPGNKVEVAIEKVLTTLMSKAESSGGSESGAGS